MLARQDPEKRLEERGSLLIALLQHGKRRHLRRLLLWGGLRIAGFAAAFGLGLAALATVVPILPWPLGVLLGAAVWAGSGFLLWRHWARPLRAVPNLAIFSRLVEERHDFRDMLRAALEFSQRGTPSGGSTALVAATIDRAYEEARSLDLLGLFTLAHRRRDILLAAGAGAALVLWLLLAPGLPQRLGKTFAFAYPSPDSIVYGDLDVDGGDLDVLSGADVVVRVLDRGPLAPAMLLRFNDTGDLWKSRQLRPEGSRSPFAYEYRFENVRDHTAYRFESGKRRTAEYRIRVVQRPIVNRFSLELVPPAYTRRQPQTLEEGRGDAIALVGSQVKIEGTSSTALVEGSIVPADEPTAARTLAGPLRLDIDGPRFGAAFTLKGDLRYHFDVEDSLGHRNADPVTYQISAIEDRPPYVELRAPAADATIPKSMQVELVIQASDDFGISRMTLVSKRERDGEDLQAPEMRANLSLRGPTAVDADGHPLGAEPAPEVLKTHAWNLGDANLFPGDFVSYWIEVQDNDDFSGRKTSRTPTYTLRLPTLGELYAKIRDEDENRVSELDDVLEKGRELQQKYERMARELKKNPEMDWKKEQEVQKALEKQKELAEKVEKIAGELQNEVQKMEEQQLVSSEIAEKMEEIRKIHEEVQYDTLREYMQRLQEAMQQISPEEIQRAMEKMELSQEEFLKRLERTKSLLEQLQREQQLDALVERTSELLQRQEDLSDRTESLEQKMQESGESQDSKQGEQQEAEKQESEQLGKEQSQLSEDTSQLERELQELLQKMQEAGRNEMDDAGKQMQEQQPSEEMRDAAQNLQQQQPQQAQPPQKQAERQLRALYEELMQAQMSMSSNMTQEALVAMQKAARQSLDVSFRQEHLTGDAGLGNEGQKGGDLARSQQALRAATGKVNEGLEELGKESTQAPRHVQALLVEAMGKMTQGIDAYEKGNTLAGRIHGEEAYADLNRAVVELNRAAKACQSGGGGSQSSRERLGGMAQQQQRLNDASRGLQQRLQQGQMSPEERAQMSRLLAEQRAIEAELRDIDKEASEQKDLLGRMDRLMEDMKEVVKDMESESMDESTLDIQERIVSRMLDASRSLHKRDYNKERESRSGGDVFSQGGAALPESEAQKQLRRDILRALESGTPEEYQELVRQYFRAIAEAEERKLP